MRANLRRSWLAGKLCLRSWFTRDAEAAASSPCVSILGEALDWRRRLLPSALLGKRLSNLRTGEAAAEQVNEWREEERLNVTAGTNRGRARNLRCTGEPGAQGTEDSVLPTATEEQELARPRITEGADLKATASWLPYNGNECD
ncbi:hypothetical protein NDU88_002377 [Pleurodeles waltl]|uniref:Uncharacterized protein n=1 Tax=Pleurodeles waltl TaxID=8319 RepID=A0AAV7NIG6_PLEWA|nr:hypothetical protein NDU88_002377 [Pleurodeles waltl]